MMFKKVDLLIIKWKQQLSDYEEKLYVAQFFGYRKTAIDLECRITQLRECINEAELLLKTDTGATHGNPPLRKHHVG